MIILPLINPVFSLIKAFVTPIIILGIVWIIDIQLNLGITDMVIGIVMDYLRNYFANNLGDLV